MTLSNDLFALHPQLAGDTLFVTDLALCRVLLMNDARYPWCILVPRITDVREVFDLRPYAITKMLDLLHPMYQTTAAYGHFGRTPEQVTVDGDSFTTFTWEKTDKAADLRIAAGL